MQNRNKFAKRRMASFRSFAHIVAAFIGVVLATVAAAPGVTTAAATRRTASTTTASEGSASSTAAAAKLNLKWTARPEWHAATARRITPTNDGAAVTHVLVHHTVRPGACRTHHDCREAVRAMQRAHQQDRGWDDIGYNFLIGGDGSGGAHLAEIYEGRGFNVSGAHASGYNGRSVGIALIGDWSVAAPPQSMLDKLKQLIAYGVQRGYIHANYMLLGHRQVRATECPGAGLFNEIKQWPHFVATP